MQKLPAKVELDFRGSGTTFSVVRLRHAYLNLDWAHLLYYWDKHGIPCMVMLLPKY